jgi:hypothetical protein
MAGIVATVGAPKSLEELKSLLENDIKVKVAGMSKGRGFCLLLIDHLRRH